MTTPPESSSAPWIALGSAFILAPVGFLLCCLIVFGSGHGSQTGIRSTLVFMGLVTCGPPIGLGYRALRDPRAPEPPRLTGPDTGGVGAEMSGLVSACEAVDPTRWSANRRAQVSAQPSVMR